MCEIHVALRLQMKVRSDHRSIYCIYCDDHSSLSVTIIIDQEQESSDETTYDSGELDIEMFLWPNDRLRTSLKCLPCYGTRITPTRQFHGNKFKSS